MLEYISERLDQHSKTTVSGEREWPAAKVGRVAKSQQD